MDEIFEYLKDISIQRSSTFILTSEIERIGKNGRKTPSVLALAESAIFIVARKGIFNKIKITHQYSLLDMKYVEFLSSTDAHFKFGKKDFNFASKKCLDIVTQIVYQARRLLTDDEFSMISIPNRIRNFPKSTPQSFLYRLQILLSDLDKDPMDISEIENLQTDIFYNNDTFDFDSLPKDRPEIYPIFLESLCLHSGFKQLVFSHLYEFDTFEMLSQNYNFNARIKNLIFKHDLTVFFPNFIEKLSQTKHSRLVCFTFVKSQLSEAQLACLLSVVKPGKITSLSFNQSITPSLLMDITAHECFFNLRSLTLKHIKGINIDEFSKYVLNLHSLNLYECGLTVGDIINSISRYPVANLQYLCVSNSQCGPSIQSLPPKLMHLEADNVQWTCEALTSFMTICACRSPLKLSVARAKISENDMEQVLYSLSRLETCNYAAIVWDGNMTNTNFVLFLKKSKFLKYVSFSGCPSKIPVGDICMLLDSNTVIETLKVQGSKKAKIGDITPICDMIPMCTSLKQIDLSCQNISNAEIKYLADKAVQCKNLQNIAFHGTNALSLAPFIEFAIIIGKAEKRMNIVWPFDDIERLNQAHKVAQDEEAELLARFQNLSIHPDSKNPFDRPYSVYCDRMDMPFPRYLTEKELKDQPHEDAYEWGQVSRRRPIEVQDNNNNTKVNNSTTTKSVYTFNKFSPPSIAKSKQINFNDDKKDGDESSTKDYTTGDLQIPQPEPKSKPKTKSSVYSPPSIPNKKNKPGGDWNFDDSDPDESVYKQPPTPKQRVIPAPTKQEKKKGTQTRFEHDDDDDNISMDEKPMPVRKTIKRKIQEQKQASPKKKNTKKEEKTTPQAKRTKKVKAIYISPTQSPKKQNRNAPGGNWNFNDSDDEEESDNEPLRSPVKKISSPKKSPKRENSKQKGKSSKKGRNSSFEQQDEIIYDWNEPMEPPPEPDNKDFIHDTAQNFSIIKLIRHLTV